MFPPTDPAGNFVESSIIQKVQTREFRSDNQPRKPVTFVDLLRWRAAEQPDRLLYAFLENGEVESGSLTYGQLDEQARAIGALIQSFAAKGERALLLYQPGLDFTAAFFGCLYSGTIAIPVPLPGRNKSLHRLLSIIQDAQPTFVLTSSSIMQMLQKMCAGSPELQQMRWLATDHLAAGLAEQSREPKVEGDHLAFLQYTSGSTSMPKGVMVSHANLLHNSAELDAGWRHDAESVIVSWLPHFHDMGLIYGILQPVYKGIPAYLMPAAQFLQRPVRWLQAISRYRGTHSAAPNFAYDHCTRKIKLEELDKLDLSSWEVAVNGAEPVRRITLEQFATAFAPCGFRWSAFCPGYGLAEATLKVAASQISHPPLLCSVDAVALAQNRILPTIASDGRSQTLVGCGRALLETGIIIVDPQTLTPCAADQIGEIWVSGTSVAQGYWNRPDETELTFNARLADSGEGPFLRTGDLGFFLDGELFIAGWQKDLLIIGGQNHYPQDIEQTVEESHPALRRHTCIAFAVESDREEHLVVAVELARQYRPLALASGQGSGAQSSTRVSTRLEKCYQSYPPDRGRRA